MHAKKNMKYIELMIDSGIGDKNSQDIIKECLENAPAILKRTLIRRNSQFKYAKSIEEISIELNDFVIQWFEHKWSLK